MSRFYVGQRVRIARCENPAAAPFVGSEDVIVAPAACFPGNWRLRDAAHTAQGLLIEWQPDHLEPILPEGWQPVEWKDCLWQPEGIAA